LVIGDELVNPDPVRNFVFFNKIWN
jgi:hypothetical protein